MSNGGPFGPLGSPRPLPKVERISLVEFAGLDGFVNGLPTMTNSFAQYFELSQEKLAELQAIHPFTWDEDSYEWVSDVYDEKLTIVNCLFRDNFYILRAYLEY
jgi:hypothetical protein